MAGIFPKLIEFARQKQQNLRYKKRERQLVALQARGIQSRFEYIYVSNHWQNDESRSGNGSTLASTELLRPQLEALLRELNVRTFFDAPCGDWNWMRKVQFPDSMHYIGADIVPSLIDGLNQRYGSDVTRFLHMNIAEADFPAADLWMCRDCLFHLPEQAIFKALGNFIRSRIPYALITTQPYVSLNHDLGDKSYRELNFRAAPFAFPAPRRVLHDSPAGEAPRHLGLWHREDLLALAAAWGAGKSPK